MGGFGSGRPSGMGRTAVESCVSLAIERLHRDGCLSAGWQGGRQWICDGQRLAAIVMRAEADRIQLCYRVSVGGEWEHVLETVRIVRVPCRLGGSRPYFVCRGTACGRRVVKLYRPGRYFLCRHCYHLAYASQSEGVGQRAVRRADKLSMRLGGGPDAAAGLPKRPKGMWERTYESICHRVVADELAAGEAFRGPTESLLKQINHLKLRVRL